MGTLKWLGVRELPIVAGEAGQWFVLHTRSRQEKALAADLEAMQIPFFLPLVKQVRYYGRRKFKIQTPLFPSYLFLFGSLDDAYRADRTKRVARVIRVADQFGVERELRNIYAALSQGAELGPCPYLHKGMWVEVRSGPFKGIQGVVEDRLRSGRLVLQVEVLGQASCLEIDASLLEPIERAAAAVA